MSLSTRDRIIRTAHQLFYSDGFRNVGLDRILNEVGVTKTTFYNHFESKDDLVLDVLNWHDRWWRDTFLALLRKHGGDTPRGQLMAIPDALEEVFTGGEFNGCIFVNVAVEFPLAHDPAHKAAAAHKEAMGDIIRELAGYAGANDPVAMAQEISLVMEGAYVTRHVTCDPATSNIARQIITLVVERHLPSAAAESAAGVTVQSAVQPRPQPPTEPHANPGLAPN